jgi:leader peptidase (prepilin peptidase) / N-methyltransferase
LLYYLAAWSLLFGLVIGSFLNVAIYRVPRHESLVRPASHCPGCGTTIRGYDNIPVVSWLLLHGRCRSCHNPISARYPLVESLTGVAFLAAFLIIGISPAVFLAWVFIAVLVTLGFIEHDLSVVPNRIVLPAVLVCLASSIALHPQAWWQYVAGCLGAGAVALGFSVISPGVPRFSGVKIALLVGAVFGMYTLVALPIALLLGTFAGISLVFWQKGRLRARTMLVGYQSDRDMKDHVDAIKRTDRKVDAEVMTWL